MSVHTVMLWVMSCATSQVIANILDQHLRGTVR